MNKHVSVLLQETVEALTLEPGSVAVDATAGGGGHSARIAERIAPGGTLLALDADPEVARALASRFSELAARLDIDARAATGNFRDLRNILEREGIPRVHGILADLGWNQNQFSGGGRGFSFNHDEPLLMTYGDPSTALFTARDIVNDWEEEHIADILYGYADERRSRKVARAIIEARRKSPIETSGQLAAIVASAVGGRGKLHPATKTFQALRIAVNDELGALTTFIAEAVWALEARGRLAVISFHSVEDRIVKNAFRDLAKGGHGTIISKKPLVPPRAELLGNPRARSAKLRIFEKSHDSKRRNNPLRP